MTVSVVIVNYNVRVFLEHALLSVREAMKGIDGEILVVDNASDDGSVEMVRQRFPGIKLIVNERNIGFAAANNVGIRNASGEFLLLLNPDTVVQEDTVRVMLAFFREHADAGLAGCKILNADGSLQLACRRSFPTPWVALTKVIGLSRLFPRSTIFGKYNLTYRNPDETYEVDAVSGSFMFLRKSVFDAVGGLDEQFFMYGEDLDLCYRVKKSGWNVYYVPRTQIIHYKGESARRSDIDEVKMFYEAMRIFVRKHIRRGMVYALVLHAGIGLREWIAFILKFGKTLRVAVVDFVMVDLALLVAEYFWFGRFFHFPSWAYPVTATVPGLLVVGALYSSGAYTSRTTSLRRVAAAVVAGFVIISALTFFFKQYAFSRMVVVISGAICVLLLPGWRLLMRFRTRASKHSRKSLFGRPTVIVGTGNSAQEILRKLRSRIDDGYNVVGFVDLSRKRVGERVAGVEILGSISNIGRVIEEHGVTEVIFSTDSLSYADILNAIGSRGRRAVNFRLVPSSLEVIIGKTHIDELGDIPLVEIDYRIDKPWHRFSKRAFDLALAAVLMVCVYPIVAAAGKKEPGKFGQAMLMIPRVLKGEMSFVGPPIDDIRKVGENADRPALYYGKAGLTGIVQLNGDTVLTQEEKEQYNMFYAKNQSLVLDLEILLKSFVLWVRG